MSSDTRHLCARIGRLAERYAETGDKRLLAQMILLLGEMANV